MSALDFTARALALRAAAQSPLTFLELQQAGLPESVARIDSSGFLTPGIGAATYVSDALADAALHAAHPAAVFQGSGGRYFRLAFEQHGFITPEQFGWTAEEIDTARLVAAIFDYQLAVAGAGTVRFERGKTYFFLDNYEAEDGPYKMFVPPSCRIEANGAILTAYETNGGPMIQATGEVLSTHAVVGPMAAGISTFQLATPFEATQFAAGDAVWWRLGDVPFDQPETYNWGWATVIAVDAGAGQVTLDRHLRVAWDGTGTHNRHLRRMKPVSGIVVEDAVVAPVSLTQPTPGGAKVYSGRDVGVRHLRGTGSGSGVLRLQYCENFHADHVEHGANNYSAFTGGRGVTIAESRGRIDHLAVADCYRFGAFVEFASDVTIGFFHDVVTNGDDGTGGTHRHRGIYANGNCRVHVERALFEGVGGYLTHEVANGSSITFGEVRCVSSGDPQRLPVPGYNCDRLELSIDGVEELYIADEGEWFEQTIILRDGMTNESFDFPSSGVVTACEAIFGGGAAAADFSALRVGRASWQTDVTSLIPEVVTGKVTLLGAFSFSNTTASSNPNFGAGAGHAGWTCRAEPAQVRVSTPGQAGLDALIAAGTPKYLTIRMRIVRNKLAAASEAITSAMQARMALPAFLLSGEEARAARTALQLEAGDPRRPVVLEEEFQVGSNETGEFGALGWTPTNITVSSGTYHADHPGVFNLASSATIDQACFFGMMLGAGSYFSPDHIDRMTWIFGENVAGISDVNMRFGLFATAVATPNDWIGLEKLTTDANWFFVLKRAAGETRLDTGLAAGTTNWIKAEFRRLAGNDWRLSLNGGDELQLTTNQSTAAMSPGLQLVPKAAAARTVKVDYFSLKTRAFTR